MKKISEAVITRSELQDLPGIDIGTFARMLANRGFEHTGGPFLPIISGVIVYWEDIKRNVCIVEQFVGSKNEKEAV